MAFKADGTQRRSIFSLAELLGVDSEQIGRETKDADQELRAGISFAEAHGANGQGAKTAFDSGDKFEAPARLDQSAWRPPTKGCSGAKSGGKGGSGAG